MISVSGRLAFDASAEFESSLRSAVNESERNKVILEISGVSFVSSPVLRSILTLAKRLRRHRGSLFLSGATEEVHEVFRVSGFISLGVFEMGNLDEAIHALSCATDADPVERNTASTSTQLPSLPIRGNGSK